MAKAKEHLTANELRLIRELRAGTAGQIKETDVAMLVDALKEQRGLPMAVYTLPADRSIEEWTEETFGGMTRASDQPDDEPTEQIVIDFE